MKKRTILFVSPRGVSVKSFRIRLSVAILLIILVIVGFTGYFIPFDSFTLNKVEQNQKKNLKEQNNALLQKILSTLKLLNNLKEQITRLETKRDEVAKIGGIDGEEKPVVANNVNFNQMEADELLGYIENQESKIESVANAVSETNNIFEQIPVIRPIPPPYAVSKHFGTTKDPFTGKEKFHYGIDFIAETGTPVVSTAEGTVSRIENHPVWGKRVFIEHSKGFMTIYAHLGSVSVSQGKNVKKGDLVGYLGATGLTSGPHVHYEVWKNGIAVNPADYFFPVQNDSDTVSVASN